MNNCQILGKKIEKDFVIHDKQLKINSDYKVKL